MKEAPNHSPLFNTTLNLTPHQTQMVKIFFNPQFQPKNLIIWLVQGSHSHLFLLSLLNKIWKNTKERHCYLLTFLSNVCTFSQKCHSLNYQHWPISCWLLEELSSHFVRNRHNYLRQYKTVQYAVHLHLSLIYIYLCILKLWRSSRYQYQYLPIIIIHCTHYLSSYWLRAYS